MKLKVNTHNEYWFIKSELFHLINNPNEFIILYKNNITILRR
jgi:hypothetical protein